MRTQRREGERVSYYTSRVGGVFPPALMTTLYTNTHTHTVTHCPKCVVAHLVRAKSACELVNVRVHVCAGVDGVCVCGGFDW